MTSELLHGEEETVNVNSGYLGADKRNNVIACNNKGKKIRYEINRCRKTAVIIFTVQRCRKPHHQSAYAFTTDLLKKSVEIALNLKGTFESDSDPDIEVRVRMININYGHNKELMEACRPIKDYAFFIDRIRFYRKKDYTMEQSVDAALEDMPEDSVIKPFLIRNKAEVRRMCLTEYNEARTLAQTRKEAFTDGREEGIEIGIEIGTEIGMLKTLMHRVNCGLISLADAAATAQMTVQKFQSCCMCHCMMFCLESKQNADGSRFPIQRLF